MTVLVTFELNQYLYPRLDRSVVVGRIGSVSHGDMVPLNLDIVFPKIPCKGLQIMKRDGFGLTLINPLTTYTVKLERVSSEGDFVTNKYISDDVSSKFSAKYSEDIQILFTQLLGNEGCRISGYIDVNKVLLF